MMIGMFLTACAATDDQTSLAKPDTDSYEIATLAGGCFWCVEHAFEGVTGVVDVYSGYTGGHLENPSYKEVSSEKTGHVEAIQIVFDPSKITYKELLDIFWRQIDPTDAGGQFADRGESYTTAIFYHDEEQKRIAEESKQALEDSGKFDGPIVTKIRPADDFYKAEEYHQDYSKKNPIRYKVYSTGSGRVGYLEETWGKE